MKRRILGLILAFAVMCSIFPSAFAAHPQNGLANFKKTQTYTQGLFSDVPAGAWYANNVKTSFELGLVNGTGNGRFDPDGSMTVVQAITLAARIHSIYCTGAAKFTQGSPWYQGYVDYAIENGIIKDGEYKNLNELATRAQYAKILAASVPENALNPINSIAVGSVHDLPANTDYAEAVYRLYNAGVLTGSDEYGTFKANTGIKRSEATALATRIVDPTLRKSFEPKAYDPYPPTGMTVRDVKIAYSYEKTDLAVGRSVELDVVLEPLNACSGITWTSSNPAVAVVDQLGVVTAKGKGEAVITAKTYNGVTDTYRINVPNGPAALQYALTADGKGYEVVGCDTEAYTAHIPAVYNGLPVVSIKGGAFMDCTHICYYTVDKNQSVYYEEGGVIFADLPEKTLVCFPPAYNAMPYYDVPGDTVAIAPYAFAGISAFQLERLTLPEGVTTLGDYAFAKANSFVDVHLPDSLVKIGEYLLQGQLQNLAFYGDAHAPIAAYAKKNKIPYGEIEAFDPGENTTKIQKPQSISAAELSDSPGVAVKRFTKLDYMYYGRQVNADFDLSSEQAGFTGEIYMELGGQWSAIVPDVNGKVRIDMPAQTGLYGVGYTARETVLRSYDRNGNLLDVQYVNGNFAFCFPGGCDLGVVGGSETTLSIIPYEPVYLISGGNYPLRADEWYTTERGSAYQFFIQQYPSGSLHQRMPQHQNCFVAGNYGYGGEDIKAGYQIGFVELYDQSRIGELTASLSFDGQICVVDNEEMVCMVNAGFEGSNTFGKRALNMWHRVKEYMAGPYFPADCSIQKIYVYGDGSWPSTGLSSVYLNEAIVNGKDNLTFAHEFVHAVDGTSHAVFDVAPGAWEEGRAEYISNKMLGTAGSIYSGYDWSYLSAADKADFFRFYYFSTNRQTQYAVGTLFLMYLNENYGEDISCKIMANMMALEKYDYLQRSEINAALFKQCVESATEVGVFQNFVRDVIEK